MVPSLFKPSPPPSFNLLPVLTGRWERSWPRSNTERTKPWRAPTFLNFSLINIYYIKMRNRQEGSSRGAGEGGGGGGWRVKEGGFLLVTHGKLWCSDAVHRCVTLPDFNSILKFCHEAEFSSLLVELMHPLKSGNQCGSTDAIHPSEVFKFDRYFTDGSAALNWIELTWCWQANSNNCDEF